MTLKMKPVIRKYWSISATNSKNQFVYIWDIISRAWFILVVMFIFIQLWHTVYQAEGSSQIANLTFTQIVWYFLIAEVLEIGKLRPDIAISEQVKDGSIAYLLVRPANYLLYHFFYGLGESGIKMVLFFLIGSPLVMYFVSWPSLQLIHIPAILLVLILAIFMNFCILSIIGLLSFLTEDISAFYLIYQKIVFVLGGLLIPVDFFPDWLQAMTRILPFNLMIYAPAKLFVSFTPSQFVGILQLQVVWLAILCSVLFFQYRRAVHHLAINGG